MSDEGELFDRLAVKFGQAAARFTPVPSPQPASTPALLTLAGIIRPHPTRRQQIK